VMIVCLVRQTQQKGKRMKRTWTLKESLEHFTLLPGELMAVGNKSGPTRLGFAILLKCLQYEGRYPRSRQEVVVRPASPRSVLDMTRPCTG
jgi:uncharacterized protein DUF4158